MLKVIWSLAPPFLSLIFLIMGSGLFNTFVSIRLEMENYSPKVIGMVTSSLYVGILVGSLKLGRFISRAGHIRSFALFGAVSGALVLAQALWVDPLYWCFIRFLSGINVAGVFIVIESWVLMASGPALRGVMLSVYLAVFYAALSAGQLLINVSSVDSIFPYCITAALCALSTLPIAAGKIHNMKVEPSSHLSGLQFFRISPLGFLGGVISGMLLAVIYGLVPVFAKEEGMGISEIGTLMAVIIAGGLSLQWPLGHLADKTHRRSVLNLACLLTALFGVALGMIDPQSPWLLLILAWFFGGFSFAIYPLSMAYVCEKVSDNQIVAATGSFVLSYGIGAIGGPLLAPLFMSLFGGSGLFFFIAMITFGLGIYGIKSVEVEKKTDID